MDHPIVIESEIRRMRNYAHALRSFIDDQCDMSFEDRYPNLEVT